jgi:rhomboid protease GluP
MAALPKQIDDLADKLTKLGKLHIDGVITDEEFKALKAKFITSIDGQKEREKKQTNESNADRTMVPQNLVGRLHGGTRVVGLLIAANVIVYVMMLFGDPPPAGWNATYLISWGADYSSLTLNGEIWRLFTSTFVHLNLVHIAGNMACLFYWGSVTERALGSRLFFLVYCLCGIFASFVSVVVNPLVVSAGASGAIAGVFGVMCVMWFRKDTRVSTGDVLGNLAINVLLSFMAGVDWVAHVGGLFSGLVLGAVLLPVNRRAQDA